MFFYRKYCRPMISFVGYNLHVARSSRWVDVPTSLHEGLDGILVEMVSRELLSAGLQEKDLIIRCNGKRVTTNLQSALKPLFFFCLGFSCLKSWWKILRKQWR